MYFQPETVAVDSERRWALCDLFIEVCPMLEDVPRKLLAEGFHGTRVQEWAWALECVRKLAEGKDELRVLDIGSDFTFPALLMSIPNVTVVAQKAWMDIPDYGLIKHGRRVAIPTAPIFEQYGDRLMGVVADTTRPLASSEMRGEFDVVTNISVVEHLNDEVYAPYSKWTHDMLRSGGAYILSIDWVIKVDDEEKYKLSTDDGVMRNRDMSELLGLFDRPEGHPAPWEIAKTSAGVDEANGVTGLWMCPYKMTGGKDCKDFGDLQYLVYATEMTKK